LKDVVHLSKDSEILKRRLLKTTPILWTSSFSTAPTLNCMT
jgi:hypothetical protein